MIEMLFDNQNAMFRSKKIHVRLGVKDEVEEEEEEKEEEELEEDEDEEKEDGEDEEKEDEAEEEKEDEDNNKVKEKKLILNQHQSLELRSLFLQMKSNLI